MPHQNFCFIFMFVHKNKTHSQQSSLTNGVFATLNFLRALTTKCCLSCCFFFFSGIFQSNFTTVLRITPRLQFFSGSLGFSKEIQHWSNPLILVKYASALFWCLCNHYWKGFGYHLLNHIVHKGPISVSAFHLDMCLIMSVLTILSSVLRFPIKGMTSTIT